MRSEGVIGASIFQSEEINFTLLETVRSLEQHMFEEVRFSSVTEFLVSRAHTVPNHACLNR